MTNFWKKSLPSALYQAKKPLSSLQREWDKTWTDFKDWIESSQFDVERFEKRDIIPALDIVEDENSFKLEVEMPGMGEEDIKVLTTDGILTIQGEKSTSRQDKDKNYLSREIVYGYYERSIPLPDSVDIDQATASFKKGMLWVNIPKKSGAVKKSRELEVKKA